MAEVEVTVGEPEDLWVKKEDLAAREWGARRYWLTLSDDERAAVGIVVIDQLVRLVTDLPEWLPASTSGGDQIDIHISILLPEIKKAQIGAERARAQLGDELLDLERQLRRG